MLIIIHGNIKTMEAQDYEDGYLQIEDGRITEVGDMRDCQTGILQENEQVQIIDAKGNLVMPGIIEAHCHMGITEEKKGMEGDDCNENVDPVTPYLRAIDAINPMDAAFNDAIQAGITSAIRDRRIAREFGLRMTLDHCSEGHLILEELKEAGFPAIVGPDMASRNKIEVKNMAFKTAGLMSKQGILTAVTTDHPVSMIQFLPICAGLAVKQGMPPEEGLRAITVNAARICGVDDRVGSLAAGKDGDVAIFDGNPMEVFTRTLCTIINGKIVYYDEESGILC